MLIKYPLFNYFFFSVILILINNQFKKISKTASKIPLEFNHFYPINT